MGDESTGAGTKTCTRCKQPHAEKTKLCPPCKEKAHARTDRWRKANPEKVDAARRRNPEQNLANQRRRYAADPETVNARAREYRKASPDKHRGYQRKAHLKRYGRTEAEHDAMLLEQAGGCAICRRDISGLSKKGKRLAHTDHDHATGALRALLCSKCNTGLGLFEENPESLTEAIKYLAYHAARHTEQKPKAA